MTTSTAITTSNRGGGALIKTVKRTSGLQAPIMQLSGHEQDIYSCKFSPDGLHLASSSMDRHIFLWNVYGDCKNYSLLKGHTAAVLECAWSRDNASLYSCSADKTLGVWDAESGARIRKLRGHTNFINALSISQRGSELIASAADDNTVRIWDAREKHPINTFSDEFQVTAIAWSLDASIVYSGGIDNIIRAWDIRQGKELYTMDGHSDTITGLRISPDGSNLLSNSMDNTLRVWDVKPFAVAGSRFIRQLHGAPHGFEKNLIRPCYSPDGDFIAVGSGDRSVVVWCGDRVVYKLPGHKGCVNEVDWHPKEPLLASCSNDKTIFIGELDPEEVK